MKKCTTSNLIEKKSCSDILEKTEMSRILSQQYDVML